MKHTSLLINNLRAVLLAALQVVSLVPLMGSSFTPLHPQVRFPSQVGLVGLVQAVRQQGCLPTTCSMLPPKKDTGKDEARFPPTQEMPRLVKQAHNQAARTGQFSYDSRNMPRGRVETLGGTTGGQSPD